jgi:hypothetical protein
MISVYQTRSHINIKRVQYLVKPGKSATKTVNVKEIIRSNLSNIDYLIS